MFEYLLRLICSFLAIRPFLSLNFCINITYLEFVWMNLSSCNSEICKIIDFISNLLIFDSWILSCSYRSSDLNLRGKAMENPNTNFKFQIEKTLELNICAASLNKKPKKKCCGNVSQIPIKYSSNPRAFLTRYWIINHGFSSRRKS